MDSVDVFEDALYTVFSHHQPARGDPGSHARYENARLPAWCADETGARYVGYAIASPGGESTRLFAHHQWDAGVYLADLVAEGALLDVRSRTVVELGAGTGLPSLVAAAVGAAEVVVTDYPDAAILANLQSNVDELRARHADVSARVAGLAWGDEVQEAALANETQGAEFLLAADVLWVSSQHENLLHSARALLRRTPAARFVLVAGYHTGRPAVGRFFELARRYGFEPDPAAPYGGRYERHMSGTLRAYHKADELGDVGERGEWVVVCVFRWAAEPL